MKTFIKIRNLSYTSAAIAKKPDKGRIHKLKLSGASTTDRADILLALILCAAIFVLGAINLDNNCDWGDDYAAYMTDGIAMAQGRYDEQIKLNVILRSGRLLDKQSEHVHAWAYPMLHAVTFRLFGFDRTNFSNLWLYKLPSLIALCAMAGVYYLLLRRRLGKAVAFLLSLLLCCDIQMHYAIRNLGNDIVFMALCLVSFYIFELFTDTKNKKKQYASGILLGVVLWYCYSVRLNGIVCALCIFIPLFISFIMSGKDACVLTGKAGLSRFAWLIPPATFLIFFFFFNLGLFPWPTSTSSASDSNPARFMHGIFYYFDALCQWMGSLVSVILAPFIRIISTAAYSVFSSDEVCSVISRAEKFILGDVINFVAVLLLLLSLIGMLRSLRRDWHIVLFIFGSFLGTCALSLGQGLRYLYPLLAFILMYSAMGSKALAGLFRKTKERKAHLPQRAKKSLLFTMWAVLYIAALLPSMQNGLNNLRNNGREDLTAYSQAAVEVYSFIQNELPEDSTIAFFKPRALYLNTGRVGMLPQDKGFDISDADYYLCYLPSEEDLTTNKPEGMYSSVFENYEFVLYRKNHNIN